MLHDVTRFDERVKPNNESGIVTVVRLETLKKGNRGDSF